MKYMGKERREESPFKIYDVTEIQKVYHRHACYCGTVVYSTDGGWTWESVGMDSGKWDIHNWLFAFIDLSGGEKLLLDKEVLTGEVVELTEELVVINLLLDEESKTFDKRGFPRLPIHNMRLDSLGELIQVDISILPDGINYAFSKGDEQNFIRSNNENAFERISETPLFKKLYGSDTIDNIKLSEGVPHLTKNNCKEFNLLLLTYLRKFNCNYHTCGRLYYFNNTTDRDAHYEIDTLDSFKSEESMDLFKNSLYNITIRKVTSSRYSRYSSNDGSEIIKIIYAFTHHNSPTNQGDFVLDKGEFINFLTNLGTEIICSINEQDKEQGKEVPIRVDFIGIDDNGYTIKS